MLIGISGKKQSGKDTVGKIIQYLITCNKEENFKDNSFYDFCNMDYLNYNETLISRQKDLSGWEIKKFADKVKDIVCIMINCTREDLESEEFKNTELGEEWAKWRVYNFKDKKPYLYFSNEEEVITYISQFNLKDRWKFEKKEIKLTPRLLLQLTGTEFGRNIVHTNIWVNSLMSEYRLKNQLTQIDYITSKGALHQKDLYPNWIITDLRFPNELKAIKDKDGISIRVKRSPYDRNFGKSSPDDLLTQIKQDTHPSETALDEAEFDYTINNNGTIEELIEQVKQILIKENILC